MQGPDHQGKFFLLAGEGADGKSQIAIHLAAAYSTGGTLWDKEHAPCRDVIFCQAEDRLNDTVVPRLIAAGADLVRIKFVKPSERYFARRRQDVPDPSQELPEY